MKAHSLNMTRRRMLSALLLPLAAKIKTPFDVPSAGANPVTETYDTAADFDDITHQWPDGRDPPALLADALAYIRDKEWMSLGATRLLGDRMDDYWLEHGVDLWPHFGTFMHLPDGSRVAEWFREDAPPGPNPIVYIGSEGETRIEAPSLEAFLASWALAAFDDKGDLVAAGKSVALPSELIRDADDDVADGRPAFAKFLEAKFGRPLNDVVEAAPPSAPFETFFKDWGDRQRASIATDPILKSIAAKLDAYVPRGKESWERVSFQVNCAGSKCEISGPGGPKTLLPEEQDLIQLVQAAREARTQGANAVRGLWHSAQILIYPDGSCHIAADWAAEPKFRDGSKPAAADIAADLKRFPRSQRWMEPWMTKAG